MSGRAEPSEPKGKLFRLGSHGDDCVVAQVVAAIEQARRPILCLEVRLEHVQVDRVVLLRD